MAEQTTIFPKTATNFSSGNYKKPSKNVDYQRLFQRNDPYAKSNTTATPYSSIVGQAQTLATGGASPYGAQPPAYQAPYTMPVVPMLTPAQQMIQANQAGQSPAAALGPNWNVVYGGAGASPYADVPPAPVPVANPNAEAAKLFSGAVANNPFISPEGRSALASGRLPMFNQINPAFYRYTSPVVVQALQGLMQSAGILPEEQQFYANAFRPLGL